jgi:hypothetical protein
MRRRLFMAVQMETLSFCRSSWARRTRLFKYNTKSFETKTAMKRKKARARLPSPLNTVRYGLEYESLRGVFLPKQSFNFRRIASPRNARHDRYKITLNEYNKKSAVKFFLPNIFLSLPS